MAFLHADPSERPLPSRGEAALTAIVLAFVCFGVYGVSLSNNFVTLDDGLLIYENPVIKSAFSFSTLKRMFTMYDPELYIPLTFLTFKIEYALFGLNSTYYHLTNLLLHVGNAFLVFTLFYQLSSRRALAIAVSLLFALHPVNVETVVWASGRKDVLASFFALFSLVTYLRYRSVVTRRTYYASVIFFALSLMAKVSVILLPFALLLIDWREKRAFKLHVLLEKMPYFALSAAFGIIAIFGKTQALEETTLPQKILMAIKSSVFYLESLIAPVHLTAIYPYNGDIALMMPAFWAPLAALIIIAGATAWSLKFTRDIAACVAFFFLMLSPSFINFSKGGAMYVASDRYVYLAYTSLFALLAGVALSRIDRQETVRDEARYFKAAATALAVILSSFAVLSFKQSLTWRDSESLYLQALKIYPHSFHAHNNIGSFYFNHLRDLDRAEEHFKKAFELKPKNPSIVNNLAIIARERGEMQKAVQLHLKAAELAIEVNPLMVDPYYSLGSMYMQRNDNAEAIRWYSKAVELNPAHTASWINLGAVYAQTGHVEEAERAYRQAIASEPATPQSYYNLGILLEKSGRSAEAETAYKQAIDIDHVYLDAYNNLGALYFDAGKLTESLAYFEKAYAIDPKNSMAAQNLAMIRGILRNQGSRDE